MDVGLFDVLVNVVMPVFFHFLDRYEVSCEFEISFEFKRRSG